MDEKPFFDIVIVGAGAAGLMTAIAAGRENTRGLKILLVDSRKKVGAKILISGGTRCNVTNVRVSPSDFEGGVSHFIKHVLEAFTPDRTREFFEAIGVELVLEPTGKYFPTTHSGQTVLNALLKESENAGVPLKTDFRLVRIEMKNGVFLLSGENEEIEARRVVLATGGLSLPETGSDGTGLTIAQSLGHSLVSTSPALTPLMTDDKDWQTLSGVTLNAVLSFFEAGKKKVERKGSFLFTHFGFSGPVALDISRFAARADEKSASYIEANFLPEETQEALTKRFETYRQKNPHRFVKNFFVRELNLPESFVEAFLKKTDIKPGCAMEKCSLKALRQLIHEITHYALPVTGVYGYKKAEVTAGGVDLKDVKVSTMESRIVPGLYFAGEILDVDGRIGGFNFQWSWSTGSIAGRSAVKDFS